MMVTSGHLKFLNGITLSENGGAGMVRMVNEWQARVKQ